MINTIMQNKAVVLLGEKCPAFGDFLSRHGGPAGIIRAFPDGNLQIAGNVVFKELERLVAASELWGDTLVGKCFFRALAPFPLRYFHFIYTADYQARLGELNFINGQSGSMPGESPGERDLEALLVTVGFRRRLNADVRRGFCAALGGWAGTVKERGIFEDGPASLASTAVEFRGTRAQFRVNASRSGQDTLNWLSLTIFNFGYEVHAVEGIKFAAEEHLENCFGPARGDPIFVEIPSAGAPKSGPRGGEAPPVVFADATPDRNHRSGRFPVMERAHHEWDDFRVTVVFSRALAAHEREEFDSLMTGWLTLGRYGGFGGKGIDSFKEIEHDESAGAASIAMDMGDTNPDISLSVLIHSLEGFDRGSVPIEAVIFGMHSQGGIGPDWGQPPVRSA